MDAGGGPEIITTKKIREIMDTNCWKNGWSIL